MKKLAGWVGGFILEGVKNLGKETTTCKSHRDCERDIVLKFHFYFP